MSRIKTRSPSDDLAAIKKQLARGKKPGAVPTALPLGSIKLWPGLFQHRQPQGYASERHIKTMAEAVKRRPAAGLHPITVWWDGRGWACVDGHHRHAAYTQAGVLRTAAVPVEAFEGTLDEAVGRAASGNTQDKLPMTPSEKSDAAWRMTANTNLPKATVAAMAGVSESLVAIMRRTFKLLEVREATLRYDQFGANHQDMRWADARRLAEGKDNLDFDQEDANEKKAHEMAKALRVALGTQGALYPHVMARALELYDSRLPDALAEWWGSAEDDVEGAEADAAVTADF